jgi:hypothetical protein
MARFGEVAAGLRHADRRVELSVDGRYRIGASDVLGGSAAFTGDVAWWLTSRYAIVGLVGRQLADPALGTATTAYASIGLRIAARSLGGRTHMTLPREPIPTRRPGLLRPRDANRAGWSGADAREVDLAEARDGAYIVLRINAGSAEIAGDFSGWQPVAMVRGEGGWRTQTVLPPGVYRFVVRVDGSDWRPPSGLPHLKDDFGGEVAVVTVPRLY